LAILASGATDIGMKRKTNQDSISMEKPYAFYLVADGMGGHNGGDIASQMSTKLFSEYLQSHRDNFKAKDFLKNAVTHINNKIFDHASKNEELKGMGTTISAILFDENHLNVANVGDSRVYLISNKSLFQLTRDHSLVQERINIGFYDREGAKKDPQKNILTRTVGFEQGTIPDIYQYKISRNDMFLICSDGLHGKVADQDILHIINEEISDVSNSSQTALDKVVKRLIAQANQNGGQDNISVIIALAK